MTTLPNPPTGFDQPPGGGTNYPLVLPEAVIASVFADFFMSYSGASPLPPQGLKLAWVHGFGSVSNALIPGRPVPTHTHDLVLEDKFGNVVFDTTTADFHRYRGDDDLVVVEWRTSQYIIRAVVQVPNAGSGVASLPLGVASDGVAAYAGFGSAAIVLDSAIA
jgi:hypothetical protein